MRGRFQGTFPDFTTSRQGTFVLFSFFSFFSFFFHFPELSRNILFFWPYDIKVTAKQGVNKNYITYLDINLRPCQQGLRPPIVAVSYTLGTCVIIYYIMMVGPCNKMLIS